MIITEEVLALKAFAHDDVVELFNDTFRKLAFGKTEFWHVSADELILSLQDSVNYHLNGMLIDAAEGLIG